MAPQPLAKGPAGDEQGPWTSAGAAAASGARHSGPGQARAEGGAGAGARWGSRRMSASSSDSGESCLGLGGPAGRHRHAPREAAAAHGGRGRATAPGLHPLPPAPAPSQSRPAGLQQGMRSVRSIGNTAGDSHGRLSGRFHPTLLAQPAALNPLMWQASAAPGGGNGGRAAFHDSPTGRMSRRYLSIPGNTCTAGDMRAAAAAYAAPTAPGAVSSGGAADEALAYQAAEMMADKLLALPFGRNANASRRALGAAAGGASMGIGGGRRPQ